MIQDAAVRMQTHDNVPQTLAARQLPERHSGELFPTGEVSHAMMSSVPCHALLKLILWRKRHDLRENVLSLVHR
jgi:hypothetical protein